jgi:hypothetical protein
MKRVRSSRSFDNVIEQAIQPGPATIRIDGKQYLIQDIVKSCRPLVEIKIGCVVEMLDERPGDRTSTNHYFVARVARDQIGLVAVTDGNLWSSRNTITLTSVKAVISEPERLIRGMSGAKKFGRIWPSLEAYFADKDRVTSL